jgi:hypothetical protein
MGCDYGCATYCPFDGNCVCTCGGQACVQGDAPCDVALGAGVIASPDGNACGIASGHAWVDHDQPDLAGTFACLALRGVDGSGEELPIAAGLEGIGVQTESGRCNEGFVRDDALLVVTIISDEDDGAVPDASPGDPASWRDAFVAAKGGNADAIIPLVLTGDSDLPMGICSQGNEEKAPNLRAFAELLPFGLWGSVCAPDYAPFFLEAISAVDGACDIFEPEG